MKSASATPTQRDLAVALQTLRLLVKETGGNYLARLQSEVARLQHAIADARAADAAGRPQRAELRRMLRWINRLDIQPAKGRRRDLKALEQLIARLSNRVDNW